MAGHTIVKPPKSSAGRRTIAIPHHIVRSLSQHLDRYVTMSPDTLFLAGIVS
jgi:hypothetical protein